MAAGKGTRISRTIGDTCKCTLDVGGIPLIRHTVQMLLKYGIEPHIVVGFNKEMIFKALGDLPVKYHENVFYSVTNSLASLWWAKEELSGESVILGNADVFWEDGILGVLLNETRDCVMLSDSSRVEQGDYLFNVQNGKITAFGKGIDCHKANCEYVGLARIQGEFVSECKEQLEAMVIGQRHGDWWEQVLYNMIWKRPIWSVDIAGQFWAEVDFIEDYNRILDYINNKYRGDGQRKPA
jgi:choline kinase